MNFWYLTRFMSIPTFFFQFSEKLIVSCRLDYCWCIVINFPRDPYPAYKGVKLPIIYTFLPRASQLFSRLQAFVGIDLPHQGPASSPDWTSCPWSGPQSSQPCDCPYMSPWALDCLLCCSPCWTPVSLLVSFSIFLSRWKFIVGKKKGRKKV